MENKLLCRHVNDVADSSNEKQAAEVMEHVTRESKLIARSFELKSNSLIHLFINFLHKGTNKIVDSEYNKFFTWLSLNETAIEKNTFNVPQDPLETSITRTNKQNDESSVPSLAYKLRGMLNMLLLCKGDIKYVDPRGKTILHVFIENCSGKNGCFINIKPSEVAEMALSLIDKGASVNNRDYKGNTPLHLATKSQNARLVKILLDTSEDVNSRNHIFDTALHLIVLNSMTSHGECVEEYVDIARILVNKGTYLSPNAKGITAIQIAAELGHYEMLRVILENKSTLQRIEHEFENLLIKLCKNLPDRSDEMRQMKVSKTITVMDLLLKYGYNVEANREYGYTPLHYASRKDCPEIVQLLIQYGADVHATTRRNNLTSLHLASKWASLSTIKLLVTAGANLNAKSRYDVTSLHLAVLRNEFEVVKCLIDSGVDVHCRESFFGFTALHMAALNCDINKFKLIMNQGLDINDGGKYGMTPLHLASHLGNLGIVRILIERNADLCCRDAFMRMTPLHFISMGNSIWRVVSHIAVRGKFEKTGLIRPPWTYFMPPSQREKKNKLENMKPLLIY